MGRFFRYGSRKSYLFFIFFLLYFFFLFFFFFCYSFLGIPNYLYYGSFEDPHVVDADGIIISCQNVSFSSTTFGCSTAISFGRNSEFRQERETRSKRTSEP